MINNIATLILIVALLVIVLTKSKIIKDENWFMSKEYTKALKGIMCIIVILVHIPKIYSNSVQDAISSFGYICVTLFFLFSSYGLIYNLENKKNYLKSFWRKRILVLLIPYLVVNIVNTIIFHENMSIQKIVLKGLGLNGLNFITILIMFYIIFYVIGNNINNTQLRNILLIAFPIVYSTFCYFFKIDRWYVEELGFSYGFIIFLTFEKIKKILNYKEQSNQGISQIYISNWCKRNYINNYICNFRNFVFKI